MKGTLPGWIERLLGVHAAESGEGTIWGLENSWDLPSWLTLVLILAMVAMVVAIYLREGKSFGQRSAGGMALLRLGTIGIVLFMLAEFVLSGQRTGLPYVVLLVDESESMGIVDRYDDKLRASLDKRIEAAGLDEPTRLNLAKTLLVENKAHLLRSIEDRYKLKVYFVGSAAREVGGTAEEVLEELKKLEPTGEASRLGAGVRTVLNDLRGTPPTAIVLLTDGINTEGESLGDAASYARRKNVPLFAIALGSREPVKNLKLSDLLVDEVVFVDDVVNFEFKLSGAGFSGRQVEVVLHEKDKTAVLASMKATVAGDGQPQKLRLPYRPTEVGEFDYVVEVKALPEEDPKQLDDNSEVRRVSVRKEQVRVLLVQSYPNFEWRRLKAMLERDQTIELKTVLQEADLEYAEIDQSALRVFPVRRDELFAFDVLILGDVNPSFLSSAAMQNIADFVTEKGGGIVFIGGPRYMPLAFGDTPLEPLIPLDLSSVTLPADEESLRDSFAVQPTDLGLASPPMQLGDTLEQTQQIWNGLPELYWLLEASRLKPAARVLAEHPTRAGAEGKPLPIFVMQYVGAGKSLFHATDETWRWRYRVGDVYFARYWVQTIRYLSRSKLLGKDRAAELVSDREEYPRGEAVRLRVRFFDERLAPAEDDGVVVMLERQGDTNRRLTLRRNAANRGIFEGIVSRPAVGSYHVWLASPTLEGQAPADDFLVVAPPGEFERTEMDLAELERAASETNGKLYTVSTAHSLLNDLPAGRQVPIESLEPIVLWNKWPLLALFLVLIVGEWVLRKRRGLL
jgi:hypothetical protein